ncbi:MAG: AlpA family phage regulatory protein [Burkholderiales bacterium]|nr:AlpA family phage regulatory protein [Burkholderiales bacterium]
MPTVRRMTALGRSTIYRLMALKLFPVAIRLGPRAVGWRLTDIDQWLEERPDATH